MNKYFSRRHVLKGLGGAVVTAPFLDSVWERAAKAGDAGPASGPTTATGNPKTFIAMFTHYGCITNWFFPVNSNGPLAATDLAGGGPNNLAPTSIAALAPMINKLLIPRGIRNMNEWTANNSATMGRGQGNAPHTQVVGSYFTCQPVTPNSNNPFSFDQSTKFNAAPVGSSLDQIMGQQISPSGTPLFMRVGNAGGSSGEMGQSNISYLLPAGSAAGTAANIVPGYGTPSQVFSALTGLFTAGQPMNADTYAAVKGQSIIDLVKDDLNTLEGFNMSQADKAKLEDWKALLNQAQGTMMASASCTSATATMLGGTQANVTKASSGSLGGDILTTVVSGTTDGADMYSIMAVLATLCNYNPVIFLKYPPNYTFTGLGIMEESHSLSHRLDNAGMTGSCYADAIPLLQKVDQYYCAKFLNLITMLNGFTNSDGTTALDNTVTTWFNEMSDGDAHNLNNVPIIQAGSAGGYFKQGQTINVDTSTASSATLYLGNSVAQCNPDGGGTQSVNGTNQQTGTDESVANAPINKYFCNIMNAMGIMADSTGFPVKGGTQPVTHYGYSDNTADFVGGYGAVKGATIHNPGEYTALKQ
jgi:hypothetical protein